MKKIIVLLLVSLLSLTIAAQTDSTSKKKCRLFKKKKTSTTAKVQDEHQKYRLAISFISYGGGIDGKIYNKVDSFIASRRKKLDCVVQAWGREGETDKYYPLNELSSKEQKTMISQLKKICEGNEMVIISENVENQRKRR